jgi:hypothetical protein
LWVHYRLADELGADARAVLCGLRAALDDERMRDLSAGLARWLERKAARGCPASSPVRSPRGARGKGAAR